MMRTRLSIGWTAALAVAVVASLGCPGEASKRTVHLQGTVTIGGQAIPANADARISFRPTEINQASSTAAVIKDGRFDAPDVPMGKVMVKFSIQQATGRMYDPDNSGRPDPEYISLVPPDKEDGIEIQVDGDRSDMVFEL